MGASPLAWRILEGMTPAPAAPRRHLPSSPFNAPPARAIEQYSVGDRVTHDKYGLGTVLDTAEHTVTVDFGSERIRLASPYAKLSRL